MSTTTSSPPPPPPHNPWKQLLKEHINTLAPTTHTPEFTLATISPPEPPSSSFAPDHPGHPGHPGHPTFPTPRLRTLIFRGFWTELPPNPKNPHWSTLNAPIRKASTSTEGGASSSSSPWESEILTFTTDVRMHKATKEIFYDSRGAGQILGAKTEHLWGDTEELAAAHLGENNNNNKDGDSGGSGNGGGGGAAGVKGASVSRRTTTGGGAWVEACFWVKETHTQWRVRGPCYLLALEDIENTSLPYVAEVRRRIEARVKPGEGQEGVNYREEILAHFANLSPGLRASFAGGLEGDVDGVEVVRSGEPLPEGYVLPEKVESLSNEEAVPAEGQPEGQGKSRGDLARSNFRVGVILPEVVDRLDLNERGGAGRRWVYTLERGADGAGKWVQREVWP